MNVVGKNLVWMFISQVLTWLITIAVITRIPDVLGAAEFGDFSYSIGFTRFVALGAGLCNQAFLTREVARDRTFEDSRIFNTVLMKIALTLAFSVLALLVAVLVGNRGDVLLMIAIACGGLLIAGPGQMLASALAGTERIAKPAMWTTVQVYAQGLLAVLFVSVLGWGVVAFANITALTALIPTVACAVMMWPHMRGHLQIDWRYWRWVAAGSIPLLTLSTFNLIYSAINIPILHRISGSDDVGWFSLGQRWVAIPVFAVTAVIAAFFPSLSAHGASRSPEYVQLVNRGLRLVFFLTVPAAVGIALTATNLMHYFYGDEFDEALPVMRILAIPLPLAAINTVLASALIAANKTRGYIVTSAVAAVLTPIGCVIAITLTENAFGNGALGAAIMAAVTESIVVAGVVLIRPRGVLDRNTLAQFGRVAAASALMIPAVLFASQAGLFVSVLVGIVTYAIGVILFGVVSVDEARRVWRHVKAVVGRRRGSVETLLVEVAPASGATSGRAGSCARCGSTIARPRSKRTSSHRRSFQEQPRLRENRQVSAPAGQRGTNTSSRPKPKLARQATQGPLSGSVPLKPLVVYRAMAVTSLSHAVPRQTPRQLTEAGQKPEGVTQRMLLHLLETFFRRPILHLLPLVLFLALGVFTALGEHKTYRSVGVLNATSGTLLSELTGNVPSFGFDSTSNVTSRNINQLLGTDGLPRRHHRASWAEDGCGERAGDV